MAPRSRVMQTSSPSAVITKMKSPATQGLSRPAMSRSQTRRPLRASMATMRPPWPMAKTVPRSDTGCPSMSLKVAMAPMRAPWTPRISVQTVRPFSTRCAVSSPDEKGATTMPPSTATLAPPRKPALSSIAAWLHCWVPLAASRAQSRLSWLTAKTRPPETTGAARMGTPIAWRHCRAPVSASSASACPRPVVANSHPPAAARPPPKAPSSSSSGSVSAVQSLAPVEASKAEIRLRESMV